MKKTLIVRYHRLGDAIIVLPLIYDLAIKYPKEKFSVLSNSKLECLFKIMPNNVEFIPMVSKKRGATFRGLRFTIQKQLMLLKLGLQKFDNIALLQSESFDLRLFKIFERKKVNIIKNNKPEFDSTKRLSLRCNDNQTIINLHKNIFKKLGYINLDVTSFDASPLKSTNLSSLSNRLGFDLNKKILAFAPFSFREGKIYPLDKMEQVIQYFSLKSEQYEILVFGGGNKEKAIVNDWKKKSPRLVNLIDKIPFEDEVLIIAHANLIITMDSANLHLASLLNTPVISIWGTTVPKCGYYPEKEPIERAISKDLDCQPCSLWGDDACFKSQKYECMDIDPEIIVKKIEFVICNDN